MSAAATRRKRRVAAAIFSGAAHIAVLAVVVLAAPEALMVTEPPVVTVRLVTLTPEPKPEPEPRPEPPAPDASPAESPETARTPPAKRVTPTPRPAPPTRPPVVQSEAPIFRPAPSGTVAVADASGVSAGELAGAARAGGGGAGGAGAGQCDMLQRLETRLRRDDRVRDVVDRALGDGVQAVRVWNGAWVRHPGEEGGGLAAVREAIIWEVGFAPEACRTQPMRGLVQIALGDAPGDPRLVLGSGAWRWSDLLGVRRRS